MRTKAVAVITVALLGVAVSVSILSQRGEEPILSQNDEESAECHTLVGPEPWLVLFEDAFEPGECVALGVHQSLEIWNKGTARVELEWVGDRQLISVDSQLTTGPLGEVLGVGRHTFESQPYTFPPLIVLEPSESPLTGFQLEDGSYGPISIGMTLLEAQQFLGMTIAIDPNIAPGPRCWIAVVLGDPYTPLFTVESTDRVDGIITAIETAYPSYRFESSSPPCVDL